MSSPPWDDPNSPLLTHQLDEATLVRMNSRSGRIVENRLESLTMPVTNQRRNQWARWQLAQPARVNRQLVILLGGRSLNAARPAWQIRQMQSRDQVR
ncbi:hypothetical protein LY76DRAFT_587327 [Colletotrichum caudatum]|nr:hypothetical protein LY76DRAFT_587327 [Colletotrichum caudatum]